jgi:hypothetical protein
VTQRLKIERALDERKTVLGKTGNYSPGPTTWKTNFLINYRNQKLFDLARKHNNQ